MVRAYFVAKLDIFRSIYGHKAISQEVIVHIFFMSLYEAEYLFRKQVRHCGYSLETTKKPLKIPKKQQDSTISPFIELKEGMRIPTGANLSEEEKLRLNVGVLWFDTFGKHPSQEWRCPGCQFHCMNCYAGWDKMHLLL